MAENPTYMKPYITMRNQPLAGLIERIDQYAYEVYKSASSGVDAYISFDMARLTGYLNEIEAFVKWMTRKKPGEEIDKPETFPATFPMYLLTLSGQPKLGEDDPGPVDEGKIENKDVRDLVRMFVDMMKALSNCQSTAYPNSLMDHDKTRFDQRMESIRAFLVEYVQKTSPQDLPETHPSTGTEGTGEGL